MEYEAKRAELWRGGRFSLELVPSLAECLVCASVAGLGRLQEKSVQSSISLDSPDHRCTPGPGSRQSIVIELQSRPEPCSVPNTPTVWWLPVPPTRGQSDPKALPIVPEEALVMLNDYAGFAILQVRLSKRRLL
jgi:hypothetical protein